jgi:hypothetical protein
VTAEPSVAEVLDGVCTDILRAAYGGRPPTRMNVSPRVYELVAAAKAQELARGNPLMLLGLDLVSDESVTGNSARLR